jgi:3-deoxy-D-manno-octulosonic acid kinase
MVAELQVSAYAHRSGVPTPRPLAVRTERALGPLVGGYFVGELVPGAMDLLALCKEVCGGRPAPRRAIVASVGAAIARMHETGIEHADLNLRNILVRRPFDEPHALVIDFDRARLRGRLSPARRMRNLKRLDRSLRKWGVSRAAVRVLDRVRLLRAYAAECAGTPVDWRAWMRAGRD